jgi:hypothetical protein
MNPQMMCLLLVFLLSITITSCSNNESRLNVNNSRNVSNNNNSETSVPTSPSSAPINTPSDSKPENIKTHIPSENNENYSALEAYKAVLQNKVNFISTDEKNKVYLNDFLTNEKFFETTFKLTHFTVIDMDDDKMPEVVLELKDPDSYEILHYKNGSVYGYIQGYRSFNHLKTDGTFGFSGSASYYGYGKLRFESNACETDKLGYHDANNDGTETYFIKNKPVTAESYNSFSEQQDGKKDVVWYEFSQKNIERELSIIHNGS